MDGNVYGETTATRGGIKAVPDGSAVQGFLTLAWCPLSLDMIRSFGSRSLRRFAEQGDASKLSVQSLGRTRRILARLDAAMRPEDMNVPGLRFHGLKGRYAVDASGNLRITFGWEDGDAIDVDLEDHH